MEYHGKLYGKAGKTYFQLLETSEDVDNLKKENAELKDCIKEILPLLDKSEIQTDKIKKLIQ